MKFIQCKARLDKDDQLGPWPIQFGWKAKGHLFNELLSHFITHSLSCLYPVHNLDPMSIFTGISIIGYWISWFLAHMFKILALMPCIQLWKNAILYSLHYQNRSINLSTYLGLQLYFSQLNNKHMKVVSRSPLICTRFSTGPQKGGKLCSIFILTETLGYGVLLVSLTSALLFLESGMQGENPNMMQPQGQCFFYPSSITLTFF